MEGLPVNDASGAPHDGGSSWVVDSRGIGGQLDQYTMWLTSLLKSNK